MLVFDLIKGVTLLDVVWQYVLFYAELAGGMLLFSMFFKKRKRFVLRLSVGLTAAIGAFILITSAAFYIFKPYAFDGVVPLNGMLAGAAATLIIFVIANLFALMGVMRFCFSMSGWETLFCGVCGYCIQHVIYRVNVCAQFFSVKYHLGAVFDAIALLLSVAAIFLSSYFLFARKLRGKHTLKVENKRLVVLLGVVMLVMIVFSNINQIYFKSGDFRDYVKLFIECGFVIIICYLTLFMLFDIAKNKDLEEEKKQIAWLWKADRRQYETSKINVEQLNVKYHDLKYLLRTLKADGTAAREIEQCLKAYDISYHTGNETLDVVLAEKGALCARYGIALTCAADGSLLQGMDAVHLYSLFANALDNAVECLRNVPDDDKKTVDLTVRKSGDMVMVQMENYVPDGLAWRDGLPLTTKTDSENHGYGLKSIRSLAEKYGGNLRVRVQENIFSLLILLPMAFDKNKP